MTTKTALFIGHLDCGHSATAVKHLASTGYTVTPILLGRSEKKLPQSIFDWSGDYIFCFKCKHILSKELLNKASIAAVNFHPAPPDYPGSAGENWAILEMKKQFGVTAHIMNEKVDNGDILQCDLFPIKSTEDAMSLRSTANEKILKLFKEVTSKLYIDNEEYLQRKLDEAKSIKWSGKARKIKDFNKKLAISPDISKEMLTRIIRSSCVEKFPPYVQIHGFKFILKIE